MRRASATDDRDAWLTAASAWESAGRPYPAAYAWLRFAEITVAVRSDRKQAELAPFIEAALKRKKKAAPVAPGAVPTVSAYGRTIVQENQDAAGPTHHIAADITVMMDDPAARKDKAAAE